MMSSCAARRSAKASCSSVWYTSGVIASKQEAIEDEGWRSIGRGGTVPTCRCASVVCLGRADAGEMPEMTNDTRT